MRNIASLILVALPILSIMTGFNQNKDKTKKMDMGNRMYFTTLFYFKEGGLNQLKNYQNQAADLFKRYDMQIEYTITIFKKGQIGEEANPIEQPDLIQVFSLPSMESFQKYVVDEEYLTLSKIRDSGLRKFNVTIGNLENNVDLKTPSNAPIDKRTYVIAFINFIEDGKQGILDFNKQGIESGLYKKYGMHVEEIIIPKMSKPLIHNLDFDTPQMILVFYLDDISKMPSYLNDPIYKKIAPLRDNGLKDYNFFMGKSN